MFDTEEQVYEALGLEPEQEEPEEETVNDEVDADPEDIGAPAEDDTEEEPEEEAEDPFAEQRSALTARHEQAMEELRRQHTAELDAVAAGLGLVDPYNGNKPITTHAELTAFRQRSAREQLKKGGMNDEQLDAALKDLPEVQAAEAAQAEAEAAAEVRRQEAAEAQLQKDVQVISALCPEIRTREDLVKHKSFGKMMDLLKANEKLGVADAFRLANFEELTARAGQASAQRTRNQSRGKDHMVSTKSRGTGGGMSKAQESMYRKLLPGATWDEILKFHQENTKGE